MSRLAERLNAPDVRGVERVEGGAACFVHRVTSVGDALPAVILKQRPHPLQPGQGIVLQTALRAGERGRELFDTLVMLTQGRPWLPAHQ